MKRTVFITGTSRGIGNMLMHKFAENGYDIVAHRRTPGEQKEYDSLKKKYDVTITEVVFDLTDSEGMKNAVHNLRKEKIDIDVLINCVGIAGGNLLAITPMSEIRKVFDVNLFAQMELTQHFIRQMIRRKSGSIINMASFEGIRLYQGNSGYGVSKAAVIAWTKVMAEELGDYGIRVNAIAPGFVDTTLARNTSDEEREKIIERSAIKRMAKTEEIANVALFLASDQASFVTGDVIRVDGGMI